MKPRYIIDLVNTSNEVALGLLQQGELDLSNNFLPGIERLVASNPDITTFYPEEPYMLSANTAMLIPNTTIAPLDDPAFRRALAESIDTELIASNVYGGIVQGGQPDRSAAGVGQLRRRRGGRGQRLRVRHRGRRGNAGRRGLRRHRRRRLRRDAGRRADQPVADHARRAGPTGTRRPR